MPQSQSEKSPNQMLSSSKFILIGEDDIDDQEFVKETFAVVDDSFAVEFAINGNNMINDLQKLDDNMLPCLIVMDYNMPGLNGAEILGHLKKDKRYFHIPKVIWSTSNSEMYRNICLELGANDYLIKPSNVREMEDTVKYMLSFC